MVSMILLGIMIMAIGYYAVNATLMADRREYEMSSVANQMIYYHAASLKACGTTCTSLSKQEINQHLASYRQGSEFSNNINSGVSGDFVYTYYEIDLPDNEKESRYAGVISAITAARPKDSGQWMGRFDRLTSKLRKKTPINWVDPSNKTMTQAAASEIDFTVSGLPDGVPVLVNQR